MVVRYKFRLYLFSLLMLAGFFVLAYRLWSLQIDRHAEFVKLLPTGSELKASKRTVPLPEGRRS